jgi:hypothetical protein
MIDKDLRDRLEGCRGFIGPFPSAPLDEQYVVVDHADDGRDDPGMRRSSALFKTVTDSPDD